MTQFMLVIILTAIGVGFVQCSVLVIARFIVAGCGRVYIQWRNCFETSGGLSHGMGAEPGRCAPNRQRPGRMGQRPRPR